MTTKHTPAPWRYNKNYPIVIEFSDKSGGDWGGMDITPHGYNHKKDRPVTLAEHEENMKLIAAAPDLLEALILLLKQFDDDYDGHSVDVAKAAIAKATA